MIRGIAASILAAGLAFPAGATDAPDETGGGRAVLVALDPGHGGRDPGAVVDGLAEKDLTLAFARELGAALVRTPGLDAVLTREDDRFVPLGARIGRARDAGADLMISLHADRLARGRAEGISVYSLGPAGADAAGLVRGPSRGRLLAGSTLAGEGDALAETLVDLARRDVGPASEALAAALVAALDGAVRVLDKRPHRHGDYAVLKAADLPAVLVELGFMDHPRDRLRLGSERWRARTIGAIIAAVTAWSDERQTTARGAEMQERNSASGAAAAPASGGTNRHRGTFAVQLSKKTRADLTR